MKNLSHYNKTPIDFFDDVLKSKRNSSKDLTYKQRIELLRPAISIKLDEYDASFIGNDLATLQPLGYINPSKSDLIKLYSYRNKRLQDLKLSATTDDHNRIINTCQNCTISEVNSLDHLLPKDEFPEFSVHPKNLFPSCTICNGHKNVNWRDNGETLFLNLYLDQLPSLQYLFVDLKVFANSIIIEFNINNSNLIPINLYNLIVSHYTKLHLLERFKLNCHDLIIDLKYTIIEEKNYLNKEQIKSIIRGRIEKGRIAFGYNFWKSILTLELINNDDFMDPLFV